MRILLGLLLGWLMTFAALGAVAAQHGAPADGTCAPAGSTCTPGAPGTEADAPRSQASSRAPEQRAPRLEFYWGVGCPHCAAAWS